MQLDELTIHELRSLLRAGEISSKEIVAAVYAKIDQVEESLRSYISLYREEAMDEAKRADGMLAKGEASALCGIPLAIKDNLSTAGVPTTCASKLLKDYVP
ncbi:MAG: Asp-tRNA(Asn)/Glu-tRNA(Gln) amidotransferase subunit GatA, partial [Firmicutes bacterium]|nr:Asp-tRNA(Asn)/Glu-tRNA(Gln) amidotransferase subunit GatA [Bacillota bacterium]